MQNPEQSAAPADFPAYPAYKPSGVKWLGDIPAHWDVPRLKYVCSRYAIYGANVPAIQYQKTGIRFIRTSDIDEYGELKEENGVFLPENLVGQYMLQDGDLLLSRSGTVGRSFLYQSEKHGPCAYAGYLVRFVPNPNFALPQYIYLFTRSPAFQSYVREVAVSTTIANVNARKYANAPLPLPPLPEQRAIAAYLDRKGDIARRYAHVARRIIDTLRELRQVEIHDAVTRGLNEDTPLKPSGVEWLGDIPAHWDTRRLRYVAKMRTSNVDKHTKMNENPVRLCNYVDVYHNERISDDLDFMRATATDREIERFRLERGDVIITKDSETWNDIGVPALVEYTADDLVCGYHLALLRPFESVMTGAYLLRALQAPTVASQFHIQANGVTRYGLTQNAIKSVHIPVPPLPEQRAIAEYLDAKTAAIDAAIAHYERMAELVAEYWTVLVADAVTGRIDLRQAAAE